MKLVTNSQGKEGSYGPQGLFSRIGLLRHQLFTYRLPRSLSRVKRLLWSRFALHESLTQGVAHAMSKSWCGRPFMSNSLTRVAACSGALLAESICCPCSTLPVRTCSGSSSQKMHSCPNLASSLWQRNPGSPVRPQSGDTALGTTM